MAAKFRKVDPRIWHDEKFRGFSADDKMLTVYCLTSGQTNRIGIFHLSIGLASEQLGYPYDALGMGMSRVCNALSWRFETASGVLFLPTWWKYNGNCGPKTMIGNMADLHDVPQSQLIKEFAKERRYLSDDEFAIVERVCQGHGMGIRYPSTIGAQEQEQEQEQEKEQEKEVEFFFDKFWEVFPSGRKQAKGEAKKAWSQAVKKISAAEIVRSASEYAVSDIGNSQYVRGPASWLTNECWLDDRAAWNGKTKKPHPTADELEAEDRAKKAVQNGRA